MNKAPLSLLEREQCYDLRALNQERLNFLRNRTTGSILDVGCGNGKYVLHPEIASRGSAGVDLQAYPQQWQGSKRFAVAGIEHLPFADESFAVVSCFEVLEHVADPLQALQELKRVARQQIVVTVPNCRVPDCFVKSSLVWNHWTDRTHVNFFDETSLSELFAEAGLQSVAVSYINKVNLSPVVRERYRLDRGLWGRILWRCIRSRLQVEDHITLIASGIKA